LDEYLERAADGQDSIYYLLAENYATASQSPHLEQLRARGIDVLLLTDPIDAWVVDHLAEYEGRKLVDVARGELSLPDSDGEMTREVDNEEHKALLKKIQRVLKERVETVNVSQRLVDSAACVVSGSDDLSPQVRRMLEASGQDVPETKPVLEINVGHPLVDRLSRESDNERFEALSGIVLDHALLAEGSQLDNPADYVSRMNRLLLDLDLSANREEGQDHDNA
jgi:molecular chaperone HtpG